jgi:uncharacterized protein YbjQ (UPF0145 family)
MTEWDGDGLPPAAEARIARAAAGRISSSLLSVKGDAALTSVGFDPVGEVMGSIVNQLGWAGWGGCGFVSNYGRMGYANNTYGSRYGGFGIPPAPVTSGQAGRWAGFAPYVQALYKGYETALHRMLLEAQALDADGVVGASVTRERLGDGAAWEYVARGTAVRARSRQRPTNLFSTDLPGADVAKLLHAGWVPVSLMWGISVAVRHDDYVTRRASRRSWTNQNVEVPGYTELVIHTRTDARHQLENKVAKYGADSAVVSDMSLHVWGMACQSGGTHDHVAEAVIVGTGLAKFHRGSDAPTESITVMPLRKGSS